MSPSDTPVFRFANAARTVHLADGHRFTAVGEAETWLSRADGGVVGGLIPYDRGGSCSLFGGQPQTAAADPLACRPHFRYDVPFNAAEAERYLSSLDAALTALGEDGADLEKVVLARAERYAVDGELDVDGLYGTIRGAYPNGNNFCVRDLQQQHAYHLGSSPELLLRRRGDRIMLHPLAGTLPKDPSLPEEQDRARAHRLLDTPKFRSEHAYLVDFMRERLQPWCSQLAVPSEPGLVPAPNVWHLGTFIEGTLRSEQTAFSELMRSLHPSPAVCGVPRDAANAFIGEHEGQRGYYAGLVGWFDGPRDCEFYMALRSMGGAMLGHHITGLGVHVYCGTSVSRIDEAGSRASEVLLGDGTVLKTDLVVFSAGIRPRDELAAPARLAVGQRGGFLVDSRCRTDDERIWAVGECAAVNGVCHGLVQPGYAMAEAVVDQLLGGQAEFPGADTSTRLKLLGVDVAVFGDPKATGAESVYSDTRTGVYTKLVTDPDHLVRGGIMVGDTTAHPGLSALVGRRPPTAPEELLVPAR